MINVAIDGPGGAGKSTISRAIAQEFGYIYVDTGALYRAIGLYCVKNSIDTKNNDAVCNTLEKINLEIKFIDNEQKVFLNNEDVSVDIRLPEISIAASNVSAIGKVRDFLFSLQQDIAKNNNCIMDGRDIGTVVLPNAQIKIFLTADDEDRARRRYDELILKGIDAKFEDVLADLKFRDEQDSNRAVAPLKAADDAIVLNTTGNTFEQSKQLIENIIKNYERG